jgi:hypothetical protein
MASMPLQQLDLGRIVERGDGIAGAVERGRRFAAAQQRRQALCACGGNRARGAGGRLQRCQADVIGISEGGLLAGNGAHADALFDVETARLDDALFEAPGLGAGVLEIQVGVIDMVAEQLAEHALELVRSQSVGLEQGLLGDVEMGNGAGGCVHCLP